MNHKPFAAAVVLALVLPAGACAGRKTVWTEEPAPAQPNAGAAAAAQGEGAAPVADNPLVAEG